MTETTVQTIDSGFIMRMDGKASDEFVDYITEMLNKDLARMFTEILEKHEVVARISDVKVETNFVTNQVEFRRQIEWNPIVRCNDCKWHEDEEPGMVYCSNIVGGWVGDDFFCKLGERKEEDAE